MRKKISSILSILLLFTLLAGCQPSASMTSSAPETTAPTQAATEATTQATTEATTQATTEPTGASGEAFTPVSTGAQTTVHVSTVDELLAAIAPDTEIILDAEFYDLSTATGYGETNSTYYRWEEVFDGVQLTIQDVNNLTIRAEGDDIKAHTVSARPRYAHVLNFDNCSAITVEGFTAGHTFEPGSCAGGVIGFRGSQDILIRNCGLYGCGVVGVWAERSKNIQVAACDIYECSYGGIYMLGCRDVTFNGNTIRDLGEEYDGTFHDGTPFMLHDTRNITIDGKKMDDNYIGN